MADVFGLLVAASVTAATVQDRNEAERSFNALENEMPRLEKIWADICYSGPLDNHLLRTFGLDIEIITSTKAEPGFHVRLWCWIVEPTLGWLNKHRLLKDYERGIASAEALIRITMFGNMARRLARAA